MYDARWEPAEEPAMLKGEGDAYLAGAAGETPKKSVRACCRRMTEENAGGQEVLEAVYRVAGELLSQRVGRRDVAVQVRDAARFHGITRSQRGKWRYLRNGQPVSRADAKHVAHEALCAMAHGLGKEPAAAVKEEARQPHRSGGTRREGGRSERKQE